MQTTFSRAKLQGIPAENRRAQFEQFVNSFIHALQAAAADGETSYLVSLVPYIQLVQQAQQHRLQQKAQRAINIWVGHQFMGATKEQTATIAAELQPLFQEKFPDCTIVYQETWAETDSKTRVLKEGVLIDWS